jgi:hypothetical protein
VRRATTPHQRLVAEHERVGRVDPRRRDEEPLALADVGRVAATERVLGPRPFDQRPHGGRLQGRLGRGHTAHAARRLGDGGDEPVPLVVPAQELALLAVHTGEQEQVPVSRLHVDDLEVDASISACEAQVEVLAAGIGADVDPRLTTPRALGHVQASAHGGETPLEHLARHGVSFLAW